MLDLEKPEEKQKAYHYKILIDQHLVEGKITEEGAGRAEHDGNIVILGPGRTIGMHVLSRLRQANYSQALLKWLY